MSETRPIRILSIAHTAVSREAGRLRYEPLAQQADLEVHLVVPQRWFQFGRWYSADAPKEQGIHVHVLPIWFPRGWTASWYLHMYPGLGALIREIKPDVIHLWEEPWGFVALQTCLLRDNAAYILEVDQNILKKLVFPFEWLRRFVLRRTDHVLVRSPEAAHVVKTCGYEGETSEIGYGVDQETFYARSTQRPPLNGALRVGYVGRLVEEKGLDDMIEALALTPPSVTLAIMGEGPHEQKLRKRIAERGLESRITFQGWGAPADVADFMRSLDVFVLLTRTTPVVSEQFGRVILEAHSCGIPVIGSQCGAIPSVIGAGGWVVRERSPEDIAACIGNILENPQVVAERGKAGIVNVANRFTYQAVADRLAQCWRAAFAAKHQSDGKRLPASPMASE